LDACNSGTGTRGDKKDLPIYVKTDGYLVKKPLQNSGLGKLAVISGCRFDKANSEFSRESVGSLSWALSKSLTKVKKDITYRGLFSKILEVYDEIGLKNKSQWLKAIWITDYLAAR